MTNDSKKSIGEFIIHYRIPILILMGLLTTVFMYGVTRKLSMQVLLEELVPPQHPFVQLHTEYEGAYGGTSTVMLAVVFEDGDIFKPERLEKIKRVNDEILFYKDVRRSFVYSIAQRKSKAAKGHAGGIVDVSALMWPEVDKTPAGIARLKRNIFTSDLYNGVLVSEDGTAALIMADCWPNINYTEFFTFIQELKEREEDEVTKIHVAGRPMLLGWIFHFMPKLVLIFGVTIAFIVLAVAYIFRNLVGLVIPLVAGVLSAVWGFGLIALVGINFNPLMVVLAVLVGARALSHSIQTTRRYLEELYLSDGDRLAAAKTTLDGIFLASLAAIVTDAAGFCVLILARIPMVQQIAIMCAFWVVSILLIVSVVGPILCIYMPRPRNMSKYSFSWEKTGPEHKKKSTSGWMDTMARMCVKRSNIAIVIIMVVIGIVAAGFDSKLKIGDTFPGSPILWPDSRYNQDCATINKKFNNAGTDMICVIAEGDQDWTIQDPRVMKRIDQYARYIKHRHPDIVGGTQNVATIVKTMNKEFHEGDVRYQTIPDDKRLISNLMFFYQMAGDPGDYTTLFEGRYKHTIIRVFLKDHTGDTLRKVVGSTKEFFDGQPPIEGVRFRYAAGYGGILAATNEEIKTSQAGTLVLVFLTVFVFCGLAYRSIVAAVLLCVPLLVANLVAFMYMVLNDIGLDVNVLPVSAVGIGVGVDYGIYILSRMEEEFKNTGGNWTAMTYTSLNSAGKGVVITAVTVIIPILLWPIMADLKFQAEMGLLLSFIMFFDMLGALLFLPAAVNLIKPKFIERHAHLKRAGIPVEAAGISGENGEALFKAVARGDLTTIEQQLSSGADIRAVSSSGSTVLTEAMKILDSGTRAAVTDVLLKKGAEIDACDHHNKTPLDLASLCGFAKTVTQLAEAGAHINPDKGIEDTPLGRAIVQGNLDTIAALVDAGAKVDGDVLVYTVEHGGSRQPYIIEMILRLFTEKGIDLTQKDSEGVRPLERLPHGPEYNRMQHYLEQTKT